MTGSNAASTKRETRNISPTAAGVRPKVSV
jgi:hypothetical protein